MLIDHQMVINDIIPNARWSRVTLLHVFSGKTDDSPPHPPEVIHEELATHNPNYAALTIHQLPSWVCNPGSFQDGQVSSISFTFEDPDGSHAHQLLGSSLTTFGNLQCTIKAWTPQRSHSRRLSPLLHQVLLSRRQCLVPPLTKSTSCHPPKANHILFSPAGFSTPPIPCWTYFQPDSVKFKKEETKGVDRRRLEGGIFCWPHEQL